MIVGPFAEPIHVTRPLLPPLESFAERLRHVWAAQWLTNAGQQHEQLTAALRAHLDVPELSLFNNGTTALLVALRALGMDGEVVTTPFTFPATPHAIAWSGATPVFCDIDPVRLTLDPARVEEAITPRTTGILAVHVYGVPCDVHGLQAIAAKHGLKLVYDAAHACGTRVGGVGIGSFGDASMFSFHATKLFHSGEGGALTCRDADRRRTFDQLKNFGILDQDHVGPVGINGKMNELQAALGLAVLEQVPEEMRRRKVVADRYEAGLAGVEGLTIVTEPPGVESSRQYFAVRIDPKRFGCSRDAVFETLKRYNVFARKYFYPLCSQYECYRDLPSSAPDRLPHAHAFVREVLCLPFYGELPLTAVDGVCAIVKDLQRHG